MIETVSTQVVRHVFARVSRSRLARCLVLPALVSCTLPLHGEMFLLPTPNRALYEKGGEDRYFVGTSGKAWSSGTFGCVRNNGWQMHEGLDIRATERDKRGEATDPVCATAEGEVAYINARPELSNYGNYVVVRHRINGLEIYSLYAHLARVRSDMAQGQAVKAGENLGIMGRTANTKEGISKDRAHLHFELNFFVNDRFSEWHQKTFPGERNDHGDWNGFNLLGIDPQEVLLAARSQGVEFNLVRFIQSQPELCRVMVRKTKFPWLKRYSALVKPNPVADREGVAAYEMRLNFNGLPIELTPRAASELKRGTKYQLLSVNEGEYRKNPARKLVNKARSGWQLASNGIHLLDLLTF